MKRDERCLSLGTVRSVHVIDASRWLGSGNAHWLEWDHVHEGHRTFEGVIGGLEWLNWHRLIKPGSTSVDVGVHSGDTAVPMALFAHDRTSSKRGRVIGVEPNPHLHDVIEACFALNEHVGEFVLERCAVTAENVDAVELADHGNANCNGGIIGTYATDTVEHLKKIATFTYTTPGRTLQDIMIRNMRDRPIHDVQFVKTDCEGYDKEILKSSRAIIEQIRPILFVEWFNCFGPEDTQALFGSIRDLGYAALHPHTLQPLDPSVERTDDITCVHTSRLGELQA